MHQKTRLCRLPDMNEHMMNLFIRTVIYIDIPHLRFWDVPPGLYMKYMNVNVEIRFKNNVD